MGSEEARNFRQRNRLRNRPSADEQAMSLGNSARKRSKKIEEYRAPKGTAHEKKQNLRKRPRKLNLKLAALLLAAGIGTGLIGIKVIGSLNRQPQMTVTQLQDMGIDTGLEDDTLEKMLQYDEYFADFDKDTVMNLTDNDVTVMIDEVRQLNFDALKDKIADLSGVTRDAVEFQIGHNDDVGPCPRVSVNTGEETQSYEDNQGILLGIGKENSIPKKVSDLILQTREYEELKKEVLNDKITKANAIQRLKELYGKISEVATREFFMDEKGNITTEEYDSLIQGSEKSNKDAIEEEER